LRDYGNFHITTIDGFFSKVVRNLAKELGINADFELELDTELPIKDAVKSVITQAAKEKGDTLERLIKFVEHKLEDDKWAIQKDLQDFSRFIFDESFQKNESAVNDEFRRYPQKIEKSIVSCKNIVAEFEKKMTNFADEFFAKNLPEEDFFYKKTGVPGFFKKIKNGDFSPPNSYVSQVLDAPKKSGDEQCFELLKDAENYRKENLKKYNTAKIFTKFVYQSALLKDISDKINEQNKERSRFILSDTNRLLSGLIGDGDSSFVFEKTGVDISSVVIDEFQDTSQLQWKIFKLMISEILSQNRFGMLVGDVKQSIYRWRNGDWKILNDIEKEFGARVEYKTLKTNFRSAKNIVEFNNNLFNYAAGFLQGDEENTDAKPFQKAYQDVAQEKKSDAEGFVSVSFVEESKTEPVKKYEDVMIEKIAEKVKSLIENGVEQGDICILCRKNSQIRKIASRLPQILPEIKIISEDAYTFGSSKELQTLISALRIIACPQNPIPRAQLCINWGKLKPEEIEKNKCEEITDFINDEIAPLPLYDAVVKLCGVFEFEKSKNSAFLFAFTDKLSQYLSNNGSDINGFLNFWDEKLSHETLALPTKDERRDGILAMSVHKSKGLQFHTVIAAFCDWAMAEKSSPFKQNLLWCESSKKEPPFNFALVPVEYNGEMENSFFADEYKEETINLQMDGLNVLYVALTRAEKNLVVIAKKPSEKGNLSIQKLIKEHTQGDYESGEIAAHEKIKKQSQKQKEPTVFNPVQNNRFYTARINDFDALKKGNLTHEIFENIVVLDDIEGAVEKLVSKGELDNSQKEKKIEEVRNCIKEAGKEEWFCDEYYVLNERSVLKAGDILRPDRVMINKQNKNVIVIDYKTGKKSSEHSEQVKKYKELVRETGYEKVFGYIWYLEENEIVEV
jgi:ATP-dependent exoDNAse (exonuclease V) beta subunit